MFVPFESTARQKYITLLEEVFDSGFLSEGSMVKRFEAGFSELTGGLKCVALANCGLGLMAALEYIGVEGGEVIVPTNTFMATPLSVRRAGARVVYADCNREDLCLSFKDLKKRITPLTRAVIIVHIGGHLAFETEQIAAYLKKRNIALIEDCAHAHGGVLNGRCAGSFGLAGIYSFYATKTMPLGEGGILTTRELSLVNWTQKWRNYGKFEYKIPGINARMNEVTAALGLVQLERLPMILKWKQKLAEKYDQIFDNRIHFPKGMQSGYYKYIVFNTDPAEKTGAVFDTLCHEIDGLTDCFPNAEWVSRHHACPPIFFGWDGADLSSKDLSKRLKLSQ
ncbi:DegT/DnrJ/EryC1/StrS family aminotransferase [uncultured Desulfobacter sp.]|uniref:DegT/DnrJ/EryC1/StrS family aminotransferase n=1 Tax=uncultured Desulfobacter sp. TaxID=240139 RepID=UPI0029F5C959|nr:DegT/DnrJ/EryC1/StrS family aminotransferase [uncultured Desulfobacter sp.]